MAVDHLVRRFVVVQCCSFKNVICHSYVINHPRGYRTTQEHWYGDGIKPESLWTPIFFVDSNIRFRAILGFTGVLWTTQEASGSTFDRRRGEPYFTPPTWKRPLDLAGYFPRIWWCFFPFCFDGMSFQFLHGMSWVRDGMFVVGTLRKNVHPFPDTFFPYNMILFVEPDWRNKNWIAAMGCHGAIQILPCDVCLWQLANSNQAGFVLSRHQ